MNTVENPRENTATVCEYTYCGKLPISIVKRQGLLRQNVMLT